MSPLSHHRRKQAHSTMPRSVSRQCLTKKAFPSWKAAEAIARLTGQVAYRCAACHRHHTGHRDTRDRQHDAATAPVMVVKPGDGDAWTARRLLQVVQVFAHHYGRDPLRIHPRDGRLALW